MNYLGAIITDIERLLELFIKHSDEEDTLDELLKMARNRQNWHKAHEVFQQIRKKTLLAQRSGNKPLEAQCLFEEICAKTLYNISGQPAPFDADSPYWLIPNAIAFSRLVNIPEADVLACISKLD